MIKLNINTKQYPEGQGVKTIFNDVNLHVEKGDFTMIFGRSGSGKTTLLNILSGLDKDFVGTLNYSCKEEEIAYIYQSFNLIKDMSVKENIMLPRVLQKKSQDESYLDTLLDTLGISYLKNQITSRLSVGEQQRVAVARSLYQGAKIILADEPTASLDIKSEDMLMDLFKTINKSLKITIIMITHNLDLLKHASKLYRVKNEKLELTAIEDINID